MKPILMIHEFKEDFLNLNLEDYILTFDDGLYTQYLFFQERVDCFLKPCVIAKASYFSDLALFSVYQLSLYCHCDFVLLISMIQFLLADF